MGKKGRVGINGVTFWKFSFTKSFVYIYYYTDKELEHWIYEVFKLLSIDNIANRKKLRHKYLTKSEIEEIDNYNKDSL